MGAVDCLRLNRNGNESCAVHTRNIEESLAGWLASLEEGLLPKARPSQVLGRKMGKEI